MNNFDKLLKNDREGIMNEISHNACIDTKNYKLRNCVQCEECEFKSVHVCCDNLEYEWLNKEVDE